MPLRLGDYADGGWFFIARCGACGHEAILEPVDILAQAAEVHRGMLLSDLESLLRCRDCQARKASLEATARIRKQAFVGGMV